jgi:predicted transcriptional regulator
MFLNTTVPSKLMTESDLNNQIRELLCLDRMTYIDTIMNSEMGLSSREISEKMLIKKRKTGKGALTKENSKVNKRLRRLVDLEILSEIQDDKYVVTSFGYMLMDSWKEITEKEKTFKKFRNYFETHYVNDLPNEFFRQIYKLERAEITHNSVHWINEMKEKMERIERKLYSLTNYLHNIPDEVLARKKKGEIKEVVIIYQFEQYPYLNSSQETSLFRKLVEAGVEFRYMSLEKGHPMGIRVIDEKWATFGLTRISDNCLEMEKTFYGTDLDFVIWCRDLMYHIWHFRATPLSTDDVMERKQTK